jgi:environmental stress-induced protein Ves
MAAFRRLTNADYRWVPWKNGGGMTQDLLSVPCSREETHWRVSIARIDRGGPFSSYPGIDRVLMPIDGDGVRLEHGEVAPARTAGRFEAVSFDGGWPTQCTLLGGPCRAFNLLLGRAHAAGSLTRRRLKGTAPFAAPGAILLLYCLVGQVGAPTPLQPGDSLCAQDAVELSGDATLIMAAIRPV